MENALRPAKWGHRKQEVVFVLILIFLENALRPGAGLIDGVLVRGLNPYFFGKCSTAYKKDPDDDFLTVS